MCLDERHGDATKGNSNNHIAVRVVMEIWSQQKGVCHPLLEKNVWFNIEICQSSKSIRWVIDTGWDSDNSFILKVPFEIQKESTKLSLASSLTLP